MVHRLGDGEARGPIANWYPYPFLDVTENGLPVVAVIIVLLLVGFVLFSAMLIAFDRIVGASSEA